MSQFSTALDGQVMAWVAVLVGLATSLAAFVKRAGDRRRAPDPMADDSSFRIALPTWADRLVKHGPWVVLTFGLVYYQLFVPKPATSKEMSDAVVAIKANETRLIAVQTELAEAARMMHDVSLQRNENEQAIKHTLTQMCLLLAEGPMARQACWDTMRGGEPRALR